MRKLILACFLLISNFSVFSQQCFVLLDCFAQADTACHINANQSTFWNEPYWYSTAYSTNDLPEAMTDIKLTLSDNCIGNVTVSFVLLLDIDNNQVLETAIVSDSLPPINTVMFGNALNPNYSGGEARAFDERLVPQSSKYQFTYQQTFNGLQLTNEVRWVSQALPNIFVDPILPYGNHKIIWTIKYDTIVQTCTRDIVVRDCKNPVVNCLAGASVNIGTNGTATLGIISAIQSASDNMTPTAQLAYGMRKKGTGTGFPVGPSGQNAFNVQFDCIDVGLNPIVELWAKDKAGNLDSCHITVDVMDTNTNCTLNQSLIVCANTLNAYECLLEIAYPTGDTSYLYETSFQSNCLKFTQVPNASYYKAIPSSNDDWLNGLSTFDLVLISKHVLGIETLNTPFKLLAADASQSGSITTFDNVLFRKLILGIEQQLPNTDSWKFIASDYVFQNPLDPFGEVLPTTIGGSGISFFADTLQFTAIKMGDLNNSATPNGFYDEGNVDDRDVSQCYMAERRIKAGEKIEVPMYVETIEQLEGIQMGISTNPNDLKITSVSSDLRGFDQNAYHIQADGSCRISWISGIKPTALLPQQPILTFQMTAKKDLWLSESMQLMTTFRSEVYNADLTSKNISIRFDEKPLVSQLSDHDCFYQPQPNPFQHKTMFPITLIQPENVRLQITTVDGTIVYESESHYEAGNHLMEVSADFLPHSGVYFWNVSTNRVGQSGKLIKY